MTVYQREAWVIYGGSVLFMLALAWALLHCTPAKDAAAEGTYEAQHLSCVDKYSTREAIDSCRANVRVAWGRLPDGGRVEGGAP